MKFGRVRKIKKFKLESSGVKLDKKRRSEDERLDMTNFKDLMALPCNV